MALKSGSQKPYVTRSRIGRAYAEQVERLAYGQREPLGPVRIAIRWFYRANPDRLDQRIGFLIDSLQGIAFSGSDLLELRVLQLPDGRNPRIEVVVKEANQKLDDADFLLPETSG